MVNIKSIIAANEALPNEKSTVLQLGYSKSPIALKASGVDGVLTLCMDRTSVSDQTATRSVFAIPRLDYTATSTHV